MKNKKMLAMLLALTVTAAGTPVYAADFSDGNLESKPILNPKYLSGLQRSLYEFLYDFLPTGQSVQYMTMSAVHLWKMPLYSLIITILTTVAGIMIFKRKDIK